MLAVLLALVSLGGPVAYCVPTAPAVVLPGPVVDPYRAPTCARCPGHRGVTVAVPAGATVRAPVPGRVTFRGPVGGRRFTVMEVRPGVLLTYGDLETNGDLETYGAPGTHAGEGGLPGRDLLVEGDPLGVSRGSVYVGVRIGGRPVDPSVLFGGMRARLVPPARRACPVGAPTGSR